MIIVYICEQEVIERAIIAVHTGREVTDPGTWVHEMPYPCYIKDTCVYLTYPNLFIAKVVNIICTLIVCDYVCVEICWSLSVKSGSYSCLMCLELNISWKLMKLIQKGPHKIPAVCKCKTGAYLSFVQPWSIIYTYICTNCTCVPHCKL